MNNLIWLLPLVGAWLVLFVFALRLDWQRKMRNRAREDYFMRDQKGKGDDAA